MSDPELDELTRGLFPDGVLIGAARLGAEDQPSFRFEAEAAQVEGAIAKRRIEFAAGRTLAHRLFDELRGAGLEVPDEPLRVGPKRAPLWPAGVTGSITHTAGLCLVAVASAAQHARLGLDVEVTSPLAEKLWPAVLTVSERARLVGLGARAALLSKVHFSAKEAVYKCVAEAAGRVLEFEQVELGVSLAKGTFSTRFLVDEALAARLPEVAGRWRVTRNFIVTSAL